MPRSRTFPVGSAWRKRAYGRPWDVIEHMFARTTVFVASGQRESPE
jgi:hypothetical protein